MPLRLVFVSAREYKKKQQPCLGVADDGQVFRYTDRAKSNGDVERLEAKFSNVVVTEVSEERCVRNRRGELCNQDRWSEWGVDARKVLDI